MKVVTIVLGILLLASGVYCMFTPVATYAALAVVIGLSMVVEGVAGIVTWFQARKEGGASGWMLAFAILSLVLGAFLLGSYVMQATLDLFIAYIIAFWLVEAGVVRIVTAVMARNKLGPEMASGWVIQLVLGILIVIFGILCIFNPLSVMAGVGFTLGMSIVFVGAELVTAGFWM